MNPEVLQLLSLVQQSESLTAKEKIVLSEFVRGSEKEMETILSKLKRAEKAKSTASILLEQTITELEQKRKAVEVQNRELEIEAALEKVRSQAMSMRKPDDLLGICKALFTALNTLGFNDLRNTMINIHNDDKGSFLNYDFSHAAGPTVTNIIYTSHPVVENLVNKIRSAAIDFAEFVISGSELDEWRVYRRTMGEKDDPRIDNGTALFYYFYTIEIGAIGISTYTGITEEKRNVLKRFGNVFELAYRRYIDIKQAEAQAREAKIEVALERVRSKTMAMHKSTDLLDVITMLAEQFQLLGFKIHSANFNTSYREKDWNLWLNNPGAPLYPEQIHIPYLDHPFFNRALESIANGSDFNSFVFTKEEKDAFLDHLYTNTTAKNTSEERKKFTYNGTGFAWSTVYLKNTALTIANYDAEPYTEEQNAIIRRFGNVFEQSYTRFLDLQKAEMQVREAQIEAALEKVRSKAMTMHNSQDLTDTIVAFYYELESLSEIPRRCGVGLINKETHIVEISSMNTTEEGDSIVVMGNLDMRLHPILKGVYENWLLQKDYYPILRGSEIKEYYKILTPHIKFPDYPNDIVQYGYFFFFEEGGVYAWTEKRMSEYELNIYHRFTSVLTLTYKRYNDIKQAEAQAREATIEASLERVRGKAMAMHTSNDLSVTASTVFTELRKLGIRPIRFGVSILNKESLKAQSYTATSSIEEDSLSLVGWVMMKGHPVVDKIYETWLLDEDYFPELGGEQLKSFYEFLSLGLSIPSIPDWKTGNMQYGHFLAISVGWLYAWSYKPYNDAEVNILKRFAAIIDLTFRRYMELQKSEANARDVVRAASVDRVRAEIASMRSIADLERITPLIWNELTVLRVPFIRCGVFIMDEKEQLIHTYLSTADGKALATFNLPYDAEGIGQKVLYAWREKEIATIHWSKEEFTDYTMNLMNQGMVKSQDRYVTEHPDTNLDLHFLPFLQGMFYVGNITPLTDEELNLVQSLTDAFSTAYARYEDFNKLEAAKQQVENTLTDLKAAQTMLIQSEKMASLGELTAGIAHEIQNPLNFVNNFSEVSNELIDEMKEELNKGDIDEAKVIAKDIKQNLEKINHHGKRAEAIVKGMLQHSRSSTGVKEPTNINALVDEYLRLSYHGLRAKDKTFNAEMKTDFDIEIGVINVFPQDMGRVLLNLFNNAFYAVTEKKRQQPEGYEPVVTVNTKKIDGNLYICVKDNGNGIPKKVVDKIFQPFFTTKPTGQGTGLGLSLSYDIVKAHGGEIKVETKEWEGTEFVIQLHFV